VRSCLTSNRFPLSWLTRFGGIIECTEPIKSKNSSTTLLTLFNAVSEQYLSQQPSSKSSLLSSPHLLLVYWPPLPHLQLCRSNRTPSPRLAPSREQLRRNNSSIGRIDASESVGRFPGLRFNPTGNDRREEHVQSSRGSSGNVVALEKEDRGEGKMWGNIIRGKEKKGFITLDREKRGNGISSLYRNKKRVRDSVSTLRTMLEENVRKRE